MPVLYSESCFGNHGTLDKLDDHKPCIGEQVPVIRGKGVSEGEHLILEVLDGGVGEREGTEKGEHEHPSRQTLPMHVCV